MPAFCGVGEIKVKRGQPSHPRWEYSGIYVASRLNREQGDNLYNLPCWDRDGMRAADEIEIIHERSWQSTSAWGIIGIRSGQRRMDLIALDSSTYRRTGYRLTTRRNYKKDRAYLWIRKFGSTLAQPLNVSNNFNLNSVKRLELINPSKVNRIWGSLKSLP